MTMEKVLVHSPNWLGDTVMALPAWRKWRDSNPDAEVTVLAKPAVSGIWRFVKDVDGIIVLNPGTRGTMEAARLLRAKKFARAIVLPQSFRSAFIPYAGAIGQIRGAGGVARSLMVPDRVSLSALRNVHQSLEYGAVFGVHGELPPPCSAIDLSLIGKYAAREKIPANAPDSLVVLPGAARGSSKRWPPEYFARVASRALEEGIFRSVLICGTQKEKRQCLEVHKALEERGHGEKCLDLAGETDLPTLSCILSECRAVLSNDSGGMHLASAMGAPVAAVFGVTDSAKTGPLGKSKVVRAEGVKVSRAVPRESRRATEALRSVTPERVLASLRELVPNGR